jgi:hypothetical protein
MARSNTRIKQWMEAHKEDHRDPKTGELNYTSLSEECAQALRMYGKPPDYDIPEEIFEIAIEVK